MAKELTIKVQDWKIDDIKPYELNAKNHDAAQISKIAKSIKEFGFDQPIVVDGDGVVIKGHGRRLAAIQLGLSTVPVVVRTDLSPEAVRAARLADNRVAVSDIDTEKLQEELASLDYDLKGFFDSKELDFLSADLGEIDLEGFVSDLDAELERHTETSRETAEAVDDKEIALYKVLGFKTVPGASQRTLTRFMAEVEASTGKKGAAALVDFAESLSASW
jgi:ParB-like chromosome segregation protein Spo0J